MNAIHITTAKMMLERPEPVDLLVFKQNGELMHLDQCIGLRYDDYTGTRRVKLLASGQIRQIRDALIVRINGMSVFL